MTDSDLEAIRARLLAATPGPWTNDLREVWTANGTHCICDAYVDEIESGECSDATFIANAPADIAALIAEVKTLTALNEHAESERERQAAEIERLCANGRAVEAQLEAVTRERDAAVNDANRQKDQHERLRVSLAVALGLLSEMEYWRQLTGTRFEAPLRNFLADMRAER